MLLILQRAWVVLVGCCGAVVAMKNLMIRHHNDGQALSTEGARPTLTSHLQGIDGAHTLCPARQRGEARSTPSLLFYGEEAHNFVPFVSRRAATWQTGRANGLFPRRSLAGSAQFFQTSFRMHSSEPQHTPYAKDIFLVGRRLTRRARAVRATTAAAQSPSTCARTRSPMARCFPPPRPPSPALPLHHAPTSR